MVKSGKIQVLDSLCGCGKTYAMIEYMRQHKDKVWMFVTPLLSEAGDSEHIGRLRQQAPEMDFKPPKATSSGSKLDSLKELLHAKENITTTHNLFLMMDEECIEAIKAYGYNIVVDEVIEKVSVFTEVKQSFVQDVIKLTTGGFFIKEREDGLLEWVGDELAAYKVVIDYCKRKELYLHKGKILIKRYSSKAYEVAEGVYILTYKFKASPMRMWLDACGLHWQYLGIPLRETNQERKQKLKKLITIEPKRQPAICLHHDYKRPFTSTWYNNLSGELKVSVLQEMKKCATQLYYTWTKRRAREGKQDTAPRIMYTAFKAYKDEVVGKGCIRENFLDNRSSAFVSKNARATNEFSDKEYLIHWVDVYPHTVMSDYLSHICQGETLDQDEYALSELIQWIFRSKIREGSPICIYIASDRMRDLFEAWLDTPEKAVHRVEI